MFLTIQAKEADDLWLQACEWFKNGTATLLEGGRNGNTVEVLHAALSLSNPRQRWIGSREPALNPAFALAEVIWIVQGRQDSAFLNYFNSRLPKYAGTGPTYHGAYGHRLRRQLGFDQLRHATCALRANPLSRQVLLQIWDATMDLPKEDGRPRASDIPCNVSSILKIRNERLEWTQIMRSNDLILGFPHNVVQFTSLQEVMAGWMGLDVGTYNHFSDSLHIYSNDAKLLNQSKRQRLPINTDDLRLPLDESLAAFETLEECVESIISPEMSSMQLLQQLTQAVLPASYRNWLSILTADACRRRRDHQAVDDSISICQNLCLTFLWSRWIDRVQANARDSDVV